MHSMKSKQICFKYVNELRTYEQQIASNPANWWEKFGNRNQPIPAHICSANFAPQRSMPYMYAPAMEHRYGSHPYASSSSNSSHAHHNHAYHHQFEPSHHPQPSAYHPANYYQPEYVVNHYATGRAVYEPEPDAREYTGHPYASSSSRRGHKRDRPRSRTEKPPYNHHQGSRSNYR